MGGVLFLFVLLVLGFVVGGSVERKHFRNLQDREQRSRHQVVLTDKAWPGTEPIARAQLAMGSVVVSTDVFKQFVASWKMLFGGKLRSYTSLIERARREAIQRMKESCPDADAFVGLRLTTSSVSRNAQSAVGAVEVVAYGTAIRFAANESARGIAPSPGAE